MRCPRAYRAPSNGRSRNSQIAGPSLRKKNSTTIITKNPATKSTVWEAPASAPAPTASDWSRPTSESRTEAICSSVMSNGRFCT